MAPFACTERFGFSHRACGPFTGDRVRIFVNDRVVEAREKD